jgi:diketogulonate reductase-like aldo/keto reductase
VRQVALAFLTLRTSVFAIPKAARPEHLEDNAGAATLRLSAEDVELIDAAFPRAPWKPGVPTI